MHFLIITLQCALLIQGTFCLYPRECRKSEDCGMNGCCTIGMERYSIPQCKNLGKKDDWCRSGAKGENRILYYPNGEKKEVHNTYTMFCPCAHGYHCKGNKCLKG